MANIHGKDINGEYLYAQFPCPNCPERFLTEVKLRTHVLRKHTTRDEKEHKCQYCPYASVEKGDLQKHISSQHGDGTNKRYGCEYCSFR